MLAIEDQFWAIKTVYAGTREDVNPVSIIFVVNTLSIIFVPSDCLHIKIFFVILYFGVAKASLLPVIYVKPWAMGVNRLFPRAEK